MAAPAGTPTAIVEQLHRQIAEIVNDKEVRERMKDAGVRAPDE